MSGPIVRKYGFPNFEEIFGKRELKHGVDAPALPEPVPNDPSTPALRPSEGASKPEDKKP